MGGLVAVRIFLTGGGGMLGHAIRAAVEAKRPDVDLVAPRREQVDLADSAATYRFIGEGGFDLVIHAAGKVGGIAANIAEPTAFLLENATINTNVLGASLSSGVPGLLNIGSSCMYPRDFRQPLQIDDLLAGPLEPTNEGYALSKLLAERFCRYASEERDVAYRTVIPSNLYGPFDHFEQSRAHLVAAAIAKVHAAAEDGAGAVEVWGDGTARREFTFVEDLASWIADVVDRIGELPVTMNVGHGSDHSVREFYEFACEIVGFRGRLEFDATKPTGMHQKLMDSSVARSHGWAPATDIRAGMSRTYEFFREHVALTGAAR